jgi:hypothetical protein
MKKRMLSIVMSMVLLLSMVSIAGITTASAETTTTTYTKAQSIAGAGVISAADNILPGADFKAYKDFGLCHMEIEMLQSKTGKFSLLGV